MTALIRRALPLTALVVLAACDRGASPASAAATNTKAAASDDDRGRPLAASTTVRTAIRPADACGWLSAAEVVAVVGPLAGPPKTDDEACVYPVPLDSATAQQRAQMAELRRKLEQKFGPSEGPAVQPDENAVLVEVEVYAGPGTGRAMGEAMTHMLQWLDDSGSGAATGSRSAADSAPAPAPLPGWDWTNPATHRSFVGRMGHVLVEVTAHAAPVTREQSVALATRIHDRIPDLPFVSTRPRPSASPDPCILLTRAEVEAVLGPLVVPPYRSDEGTPLAQDQGRSCAYYTAGHHALVVTPTWQYGGQAMEATRMVGGLVEKVAQGLHNDAADTLDQGPWEEAGGDPSTGQLYFLKGDRLLELGYLISSTDMNGAVRLARIAVGRL